MSGSSQATLGKYQIIREIARSNDIVYEAYDPVMNRRVALKELAMPSGSTESQRQERTRRFVREAKAAGSLNHPNIVTIYECGEDVGRHFIAMEYLEGHTLRNELDTHGFLPVERALDIGKEVLEALEYAHQNGVIHRDIKPENIQLLPDGRVKITDFGIARLTFEPNLTIDGQVFGTPSYMSPEQVAGKEIDARSDLFSLGVVIYEMLAGQKPFAGDSVVSITYSIVNAHPSQPQQANHTVWQLLSQALEKTPVLRYATAADMKKALEHARSSLHEVALNPYGYAPSASGATVGQGIPVAPPINNPYLYPAYGQAGIAMPTDPYGQAQGAPYPQGYAPVPVYYPPAPKRPFVSPETKDFLGRLIVTVIVLGTLFGLVIVAITSLGAVVERQQRQMHDQPIRAGLEERTAGSSLEEGIKAREEVIGKLRDDVSRQEERRKLASQYFQLGERHVLSGRTVEASSYFEMAHQADPSNPRYSAGLADLYSTQAEAASEPSEQLALWERAAEMWGEASRFETDTERRVRYADYAARTYYGIAQMNFQSGDTSGAREKLYLGRRFAPEGSQVASQIEALLSLLTQ
jgi:tetratricopeptide (TPR) repeat protein